MSESDRISLKLDVTNSTSSCRKKLKRKIGKRGDTSLNKKMSQNILILIGLLVGLKVLYNMYCWILMKWYYKEYVKFVKESDSWFIKEHRQQIISLFEKAGITDTHMPVAEPGGFGLVKTGNVSIFRNLAVIREDIVTVVVGFFHEAIGVYKQRIFETFNPIYWVEQFFQLPKTLLNYLGIGSKSIIVKFFQLAWWIIVILSTIIGIIFNKEFTTWIQRFI